MTSKFCFAKNIFTDYHEIIEQIAQALNVEESSFAVIENCKDIWVRDFMPYQRHDGKYVQYRYTPDYLQNKKDIQYQTNTDDVRLMDCSLNEMFQENLLKTNLILDGGNIIKCLDGDYKPCVIMTEKVLYENKDKTYCEIINELQEIFDADIILIPWDTEEPYGHADGMIRYIRPGVLLINNYRDIDEMLYTQLTRTLRNRFEIHQLEYGKHNRKNSWCHINYIETDTDVLIPACGIASDKLAKSQIEKATGKKCHLIKMPKIIKDGGALHCISWELKSTEPINYYLLALMMHKQQWNHHALINMIISDIDVYNDLVSTFINTLDTIGKSVCMVDPYMPPYLPYALNEADINHNEDEIDNIISTIKKKNENVIIVNLELIFPKELKRTRRNLIKYKQSVLERLKHLSEEIDKPIIFIDSYDEYFDMFEKGGYIETDDVRKVNEASDIVCLVLPPLSNEHKASCEIIKNEKTFSSYTLDLWSIGNQSSVTSSESEDTSF